MNVEEAIARSHQRRFERNCFNDRLPFRSPEWCYAYALGFIQVWWDCEALGANNARYFAHESQQGNSARRKARILAREFRSIYSFLHSPDFAWYMHTLGGDPVSARETFLAMARGHLKRKCKLTKGEKRIVHVDAAPRKQLKVAKSG